MSPGAWMQLRRANEALARATAQLAPFIGGRDTANPEQDVLVSLTAKMSVGAAIFATENALTALQNMAKDIEDKRL